MQINWKLINYLVMTDLLFSKFFLPQQYFFSNKLRIYFSSTKQDKYDASQSICTDNIVTDFLLFIHRIKLRWKLFWEHPPFKATVVIIVRKILEKTRVLQFIDAQPLIGNIFSNNIVLYALVFIICASKNINPNLTRSQWFEVDFLLFFFFQKTSRLYLCHYREETMLCNLIK